MHNMLITLSLIAMVGAAVLSFMNKDNLAAALDDQVEKQKSLQVAQDELADSKATLADLQADVASATTANETFSAEAAKLADEITAKDDELETLAAELTAAKDERDAQNEKLAKVGDLEAAVGRLEELQTENASFSNQLAGLQSTVESATRAAENLQAEIDAISKQIEDSEKGLVPANFSASVAQVYPRWGFVVLGAGNQQRAAEGATLAVRRGGNDVAHLRITDVLQNRSVADIVQGSLAPGASIEPGDRVVPVQK